MHSQILRRTVAPVLALLISGCASGKGPKVAQVAAPVASQAAESRPAPAPAQDPIVQLIAQSDSHFNKGQQELSLGHLEQAKHEFDRALDVLLESQGGARADARVREHFDRLVDRISVLEQQALATGDGFTETRTDPASIDQLMALGTFDTTPPQLSTVEAVEADLQNTSHDVPIPTNDRVLRWVEVFQGRLREFLSEGLARGAQYLPMINRSGP